jgi:hypothetical protein
LKSARRPICFGSGSHFAVFTLNVRTPWFVLSLFLTNVVFIWRPRLSSDFPMWLGTRTLLNGIFVRTP